MRVITVAGQMVRELLRVVAKVIGSFGGARPATDDHAIRTQRPARDEYRP